MSDESLRVAPDDQPDPPVVSEYQPDDVDPETVVHDDVPPVATTDRGDRVEALDDDRPVPLSDDRDAPGA
ncbi:hypothetical protein [Herbiconiux flava]|uniref:Uncharacterized protein n=1 Tax=Herbiconiux flava TaxID=881268 RepID=A0A852SQ74_9MICO|nr:hypothetical protein [Herbiconiux flava]NYD70942.1 hypothetical protein [Herbiconiux flava]GLK19096.1 hypothetical protein GCM10017602_35780 [Herbiconiux flava]